MDRRRVLVLTAGVLASGIARAEVYFDEAGARRALFPRATRFEDRSLTLSKAQLKQISVRSRTRFNMPLLRAADAWIGEQRIGRLFIDRVYGKHEFITYAVALDAQERVAGVEIMEFIESYGDQVRGAAWRAQFHGKRVGEALEIDRPIRNISGATLSCAHVTDGVRRLLVTNALLFAGGVEAS
jgi:hypothetical protein